MSDKPFGPVSGVVQLWSGIASAPETGYVVGAWLDGSRWRFAQMFRQYDEWTDVHSDRILSPTHWAPLPEAPLLNPSAD